MKRFRMSLLFITVAFATSAFAKGAGQTASYIVPTPEHLVQYSRFEVDIVKSYSGVSSDEISYLFPKDLTGDPALQVNFKRISSDFETGVSLWDAKEMTATCTDDGEVVQCNMYLKKETVLEQQSISTFLQLPSFGSGVRVTKPVFDFSKAQDFIKGSGFPQNIIDMKLDVLDQFLDSEPAGILSYKYN